MSTSPKRRKAAYLLAFGLGLAVAAMGQWSSFSNLSAWAATHGFPWGPALPIGLDLGIPALLILDALRESPSLRYGAWGLALFTVYANAAVVKDHDFTNRVLHAMMPAVAVVIFEAVRRLRDDPALMDRIRFARWVLSPVRTMRLKRRMVLWEITRYSEALARESVILHARAVLRAELGKDWKRSAPVTLVHQLKTGQVPSEVLYGTDWQGAVEGWVRETLDRLAPNRVAGPDAAEGSEPVAFEVSDAALTDLAGPLWDRTVRHKPDDVSDDRWATAVALDAMHYRATGQRIPGEQLRQRMGIAKPQALAIARAIGAMYETGSDLGSDDGSEGAGEVVPFKGATA